MKTGHTVFVADLFDRSLVSYAWDESLKTYVDLQWLDDRVDFSREGNTSWVVRNDGIDWSLGVLVSQ